ncbi:hypothetical protein T484DRAFT_1836451 [Baffinella frigidus]|nr:hypothetical protein T484DRAFT_1836451 [Cryptophyta sp. CCMP2293]
MQGLEWLGMIAQDAIEKRRAALGHPIINWKEILDRKLKGDHLVVIGGMVFDVRFEPIQPWDDRYVLPYRSFERSHPGGESALLSNLSKDATAAFIRSHPESAHESLAGFFVGDLQGAGALERGAGTANVGIPSLSPLVSPTAAQESGRIRDPAQAARASHGSRQIEDLGGLSSLADMPALERSRAASKDGSRAILQSKHVIVTVTARGDAEASPGGTPALPRLAHLTTINPFAAIVNAISAPGPRAFPPNVYQDGSSTPPDVSPRPPLSPRTAPRPPVAIVQNGSGPRSPTARPLMQRRMSFGGGAAGQGACPFMALSNLAEEGGEMPSPLMPSSSSSLHDTAPASSNRNAPSQYEPAFAPQGLGSRVS